MVAVWQWNGSIVLKRGRLGVQNVRLLGVMVLSGGSMALVFKCLMAKCVNCVKPCDGDDVVVAGYEWNCADGRVVCLVTGAGQLLMVFGGGLQLCLLSFFCILLYLYFFEIFYLLCQIFWMPLFVFLCLIFLIIACFFLFVKIKLSVDEIFCFLFHLFLVIFIYFFIYHVWLWNLEDLAKRATLNIWQGNFSLAFIS